MRQDEAPEVRAAIDERAAREREEDAEALHLPLIDAASDEILDAAGDEKPSWRGWIHAVMAPLALVMGLVLVVVADGAVAKLASAVFALTSVLMFGTSAVYHRFRWREAVRVVLKRLDHANIFLLIAGTYTPIALLALSPGKAALLLGLVWGGTVLGIAFRVFWLGAPRWLYVPLYLALGWAAVAYLGDLWQVEPVATALVALGGLAYSVGAGFYGFKRPNPFPGRFGFHELFHACTVIAFLCHWTAVLLLGTQGLR